MQGLKSFELFYGTYKNTIYNSKDKHSLQTDLKNSLLQNNIDHFRLFSGSCLFNLSAFFNWK